ncbi:MULTISPECIES: Cof-type HAD-IIB family hydrolase [unclassified Arenibacter]|uniref:Cof-type HAD-IIB family hydrolase n=1 Tax=unclassified Arenibacter TaxID=2615047 RepID=UPI000E342318|nr:MULTISPECIES: Cof-type HAD-IIB family hydrolase [unclassified Arenibacter]MCM4165896.1 Cof-type HAD-IIB family hydrolase [Arenibacter sp. A80]RFT54525.1 HAD family phosphatase [Arenibacter sp. P308M17]
MDFKILCSDLDGTLLTYKDNVSDLTISEIKRIKDRLRIILVSARMPQSMTYIQKSLGIENEPIICYNGALVLHGSKELLSTFIYMDQISSIYDMANNVGIQLGLYSNREWYVEIDSERVRKEIKYTKTLPIYRNTKATIEDWENRRIGAHKIMLMGNKDNTDGLFPVLQKHFSHTLNLYRSNDTLIEIAPKSVSKLTAIKLLLGAHESLNDVIAFGDNYNDMEMLQNVGRGVAVANAREEVKRIARDLALKNSEDGVALYIKQHILI